MAIHANARKWEDKRAQVAELSSLSAKRHLETELAPSFLDRRREGHDLGKTEQKQKWSQTSFA